MRPCRANESPHKPRLALRCPLIRELGGLPAQYLLDGVSGQAEDLGGHVRQGEHSFIVTFWKFPKKQTATDEGPVKSKGETGTDHFAPLLRYYNVFNLEQNRD